MHPVSASDNVPATARGSGNERRRAAARSQPPFAEAVTALLQPLLNYARGELHTEEALGNLPRGAVRPEDLVDAALAEAIARAEEAPHDRLYPWLRRLVRRALAREVAETRRRRRERSLDEPVGTGQPDVEGELAPRRLIDILPDPTAPIPEQVAESDEFQHALVAILCQLPADWRELFLLHVRDGYSIAAIAHLEGLTPREVRQRIQRAREFLRARLAEEYADTALPAPTEELFDLLRRIEPTPEHLARARDRLATAPAPTQATTTTSGDSAT